jgi:SPP1 family predicted phage head-tail adaptor
MPIESLSQQSGLFRFPITIQAPNSGERDAAGQPISGDWTTVLSCRAKIESTLTATYKSGTQAEAITSVATYLMTIRWPGSAIKITPDMRVVFNGDNYVINAINNSLQRNRYLQIFCMRIDS